MAGEQHGWQPDPFGIHELRYFSQGEPTKLVKDGAQESYDPPPTALTNRGGDPPQGSAPGVVPADSPDLAAESALASPSTARRLSTEPRLSSDGISSSASSDDSATSDGKSFRCSHCGTEIMVERGLCSECRQRALSQTIGGKWVMPIPERAPPSTNSEIPPAQDPAPAVAPSTEASALTAPTQFEPQSPVKVPIYKRPLWWILAAVVILAIVVLFVNPSSKNPKTATPPSGAPGKTVTTLRTTTTSTPTPVAPQPSAQAAATALMSSWASGNRPVALSVATTQAVATLFAVPYPGSLAISRGCSAGSAPIVCTYGPPGGASPSDPIYSLSVLQATDGRWYVGSAQIMS